MSSKTIMWVILAFVVLLLLNATVFVVNEGQEAILVSLGKIVTNSQDNVVKLKGPGIHFKIPLFYAVRKFDTRLQTLDIQASRIVTAEKKDVIVDYYVKWKISNPALFFTRTNGDAQQAEILLEQQLNDSLRAEFGRRTITDVISDDRVNIMDSLNKQANQTAQGLGIDVIDVRIKRIDLPPPVSAAVFKRMAVERERVAAEHRALGAAKAEGIRAQADATATVAIATAKADAASIRGAGDATAAKIYAEAYSKDPSFFAFYRSMTAYKQIFDSKKDILVLRPDNQFFKYFNGASSGQVDKIAKK